jgi:hypothetical protein
MMTRFIWFSETRRITSVSSHSIACLFKEIQCVSLEVETEFINIILILCFKRTEIYDFYVHLRTRVTQGWNATLIGGTPACCANRACFIVSKSGYRMLYYRKQRKSRHNVTQRQAKHCATCCQKVTNFLTAGPELSTLLELQPTTGRAPQPVPPTTHRDNIFP